MEELHKTAMTYYNTVPAIVRASVDQFFNTMDVNGDGNVSFFEFSNFMNDEGYGSLNNPTFFDEIKCGKGKELNKKDVITLYYILKSARPLCRGCRRLIVGLYFTCETCYRNGVETFCLHPQCFSNGQYIHNHANFLDNFTLLERLRNKHLPDHSNTVPPSNVTGSRATTSSPTSVVFVPGKGYQLAVNPNPNPNPNPTSSANVQQRKRRIAYEALEMTLAVASAASFGSEFCSIM